jgi:putative hemolysin
MNKTISLTFIFLFALSACTAAQPKPTALPVSTDTPPANLPNPASVYCEQQGNTVEVRTASDGSQTGYCIFPDGSECDEWAYFRGECAAPKSLTPESPSTAPTEFPTPRPIDPAEYQGFWTYTHPVYGFSIMLPEDWAVEEVTTGDPLMNGHLLMLGPRLEAEGAEGLQIRMTFRPKGDEALLWPTGVGAGQFIEQGTLDVAGQPARRLLFVCPTGQVNSIWYHGLPETSPNIDRGGLEFGFISSLTSFYCEEGHSLSGKLQHLGEMIIASLKVP